MRTVGIDLAAQPAKTGVATVEWESGRARVTQLDIGATDQMVLDAIASAAKTGIDCPLGWPRDFIAFITQHQNGHVTLSPGDGGAWRRRLSYRVTDLHVRTLLPGVTGLSVSTDRIGVTAMRSAALLAQLAGAGAPVDRAGSGAVVEVYPAATLLRWGFRSKGYKGTANAEARGRLIDELLMQAPWLDLRDVEGLCRSSDDALDAVIAALAARAAAMGLTEPIPAELQGAAEVEGWMAIPQRGTTLADLV
jgi:predicted nuclease with RNAse H fold